MNKEMLLGILTYARALRFSHDLTQASKARLILRGNMLVLFAILITLIADATAVIARPFPPSYWGNVLLAELATMVLLAIIGAVALTVTFWRTQTVAPPRNLTPADGIDDLWTLVQIPVTKASRPLHMPRLLVEWVERFNSNWLFARLGWIDPRRHPWRFAGTLGLLAGIGLTLAQLLEGLPPSLRIGLIVAGIFISAEFVATLAGFAILGGYLGLRPACDARL